MVGMPMPETADGTVCIELLEAHGQHPLLPAMTDRRKSHG
jgi:hypothetical protein